MKAGILGLAVAALMLVGTGSARAAENFKPVYDATGKITNIPDPNKDLDAFAKYFIWTKVKNARDYLLRKDVAEWSDKQWQDAGPDKDGKLKLKDLKFFMKEQLANAEAKKGAKKDDGKK